MVPLFFLSFWKIIGAGVRDINLFHVLDLNGSYYVGEHEEHVKNYTI